MRNALPTAPSHSPEQQKSPSIWGRIAHWTVNTAAGVGALIGSAGGHVAEAQFTDALPLEKPSEKTKAPAASQKAAPLSFGDIMKQIRTLGHSHHPKRHAATTTLRSHFNRDVMVLLAPSRFSADPEVRGRAYELLPDDVLEECIDTHHPLPPHIEDHWLWLQSPTDKKQFRMPAFSGPQKDELLTYEQTCSLFMKKAWLPYHNREKWGRDDGQYRRALWLLCKEKRNATGHELLNAHESDLQAQWELLKTPEDFPSWKINRFRTGMRQAVVDVEKFAEGFIRGSDEWRIQHNYKDTQPPRYPPHMQKSQKKTGLDIRPPETIAVVNAVK